MEQCPVNRGTLQLL